VQLNLSLRAERTGYLYIQDRKLQTKGKICGIWSSINCTFLLLTFTSNHMHFTI
jgi:hypothetical protein